MGKQTVEGKLGLRILSGSENPNNIMFGAVGDLYLRNNAGVGEIWQKTSGDNTQTGWVKLGSGGGGANLGNSDLTQTDAVREYNGAGKALGFILNNFGILATDDCSLEALRWLIRASDYVAIEGSNRITLKTNIGGVFEAGTSNVASGIATDGQVLTLTNATTGECEWRYLVYPGDYADDAAAGAGGVPIGGIYEEEFTGNLKRRNT